MGNKNILVVGGYGKVGAIVSEKLSAAPFVNVIVGGRNENKAKKLAEKLNCSWRVIDVYEEDELLNKVEDVHIILNCFIDSTYPNSNLIDAALAKGIYYVDLAGVPIEYSRLFLTYYKKARKSNCTLITGIGINPGIPGIFLFDNKEYFDRIEKVNIYFSLGAKLKGISPLSLQGLGIMMQTPPLEWSNNNWLKPAKKAIKRFVGKPFSKKIYFFPSMATEDLMSIPWKTNVQKLNVWSGMENAFQAILLSLGIKYGYTKTVRKTRRLLLLLKKFGKQNGHNEIKLEIESIGYLGNDDIKRTVAITCDEEYATALAMVVLCEQILEGKITKNGAFVPHEIVPSKDFIEKLKRTDIKITDKIEKIG